MTPNSTHLFIVGLANLGNTCFLNSCIQVLQHTYELHDIVDTNQMKSCDESFVLNEWNEMRKLMQTQNGVLFPNRFVNAVHKSLKRRGANYLQDGPKTIFPNFSFL